MISIEMARCVAKITGDGCLSGHYIRYNNTCPELITEFVSDIQHEFNHSKFTHGITNSNTPFVQIHGKRILNEFLAILPSYRSADVHVPDVIISASPDVKAAYLRALFDDEGSVCVRIFNRTNEWKRNVKIDSKSLTLLQGIKILLLDFGIETNKISTCTKEDKMWHYLGISRKENFVKFEKNIGFSCSIKMEKLDFLIRTYKKTYKRNPSDFLLLKDELKKIIKPRTAPIPI